ncbi:MAG: TerB family tellurite resistance protein [Alphaproteobacteria bacterium]|nr:TerB family tellurite resistance protein [Alphaproteobacteria bacterium]
MDKEYDYISTLSAEEKRIFVESFCCMVYTDGNVAKEEIEFLKGIGKLYGITEQEIVSILKNMKREVVMENIAKITDRPKALQLVKELCYLANSDTGLDDREIDFIIDVAETVNIDSEKLKQINKWVLDKIVLQKTGEIILETEGK